MSAQAHTHSPTHAAHLGSTPSKCQKKKKKKVKSLLFHAEKCEEHGQHVAVQGGVRRELGSEKELGLGAGWGFFPQTQEPQWVLNKSL